MVFSQHVRRWLGFLGVIFLLTFFSVRSVYADESGLTILDVTQQDLNNDGKPDLTIIDCAFATGHDRIYVYDQGNDMRSSADWQDATDFNNDVWLYDIDADGTIQLIVKYQDENGHATAYLYDDQDDDGQVNYKITGTKVKVLESPFWTGRIVSSSDWYLPDHSVNLDMKIEMDGPMSALDRVPKEFLQDYMKHDGAIDLEFEEVTRQDGTAQYALRRLLTPSPADWGFERAWLWSNEGHYRAHLPKSAFFPLLPIPIESGNPLDAHVRYFDLPPTVRMNWAAGKIQGVGLEGYPIGQGYHFNDNSYIVKNQVNDVSFESPQAYYDLANNHDAFAELHIRFFTHPPDDPSTWSLPHMEGIPWQSISYDWNLFNPGTMLWDFKVGLGGNYTIDSTVSFRDFTVRTVPYEQLPSWITERPWKLTTFLAREGPGYESSEGLYEWQTDTGDDPEVEGNHAEEARDATSQYMLGLTSTPPDMYFTTAHPGFRAERHFASPIQPYLYFSPIDHKLHLREAESGIWNIDNQHMIRYANLDGDAYLDQWQYLENDITRRELDATKSYLLYTDENEFLLKKKNVLPSLFESLPPRTHQEWLVLGQRLKANQPDFEPVDFKAMLQQFNGQELQILGGSAREFRYTAQGGFRFVLALAPGFQVQGNDFIRVADLQPGEYSVSYTDRFVVQPLSPPSIQVTLVAQKFSELEINPVSIQLHNNGLEDVPEATLELWATSPDGATSMVAAQNVQILAQEPMTLALEWSPALSGTWILTPKIRQLNHYLYVGKSYNITVSPSQTVGIQNVLSISTPARILPLLVIVIMIFAVLAALIYWYSWWRAQLHEGDDEHS